MASKVTVYIIKANSTVRCLSLLVLASVNFSIIDNKQALILDFN